MDQPAIELKQFVEGDIIFEPYFKDNVNLKHLAYKVRMKLPAGDMSFPIAMVEKTFSYWTYHQDPSVYLAPKHLIQIAELMLNLEEE